MYFYLTKAIMVSLHQEFNASNQPRIGCSGFCLSLCFSFLCIFLSDGRALKVEEIISGDLDLTTTIIVNVVVDLNSKRVNGVQQASVLGKSILCAWLCGSLWMSSSRWLWHKCLQWWKIMVDFQGIAGLTVFLPWEKYQLKYWTNNTSQIRKIRELTRVKN